MKRARLVCTRCGRTFETEVFEPGEAEEKRLPSQPVRCPECGGRVERVS